MSGPGLKAGNRCSRTSGGRAVGHCERANAPEKMQPNSRQRFLSVIQLLVSFTEMLCRVFESAAQIRRFIANSRRNFAFFPSRVSFIHGTNEKMNNPSRPRGTKRDIGFTSR